MNQLWAALLLLVVTSPAVAAPPTKPPAGRHPKVTAPAMSCTLLTPEGPRGGRLEIEGHGVGQSPLVRIAGKVTRMLERTETKISVQIPADSNGGLVTLTSGKLEISCGTLTIVGKD
jgi:hypothetical protein